MGKENKIAGPEQIDLFPNIPTKKKEIGLDNTGSVDKPENKKENFNISAEEIFIAKLWDEFKVRREELMSLITEYLNIYLPSSNAFKFGILRKFLGNLRLEEIKKQRREDRSNELGFWLARIRDLTDEIKRPMKRYLKDAKRAEENLTRGLPEDY